MEEKFSVPYVGMIIERNVDGKKEILVQTRYKPDFDRKYSGALEIPAGKIREYEDIFEAAKREVEEETGLKVKKIHGDKSEIFNVKDDKNFGFKPFCCAQVTKAPNPYIGFYFICEVKDGKIKPQLEEVRDPKWVEINELKNMVEQEPDKFYVLHIAALKMYLENEK